MTLPCVRVFEHEAVVYRRSWRGSAVSTILFPFLYLAALGLGTGGYVTSADAGQLHAGSYLAFLGPALLVAQAMTIGAAEGTWPVMARLVWLKTYEVMLYAPLRAADVLAGTLLWIAVRVSVAALWFLAVMALLGSVASPAALLCIPVAALTGLAFAGPLVAFTATQTGEANVRAVQRLVLGPVFLFSGTFFPVDRLPGALATLATLSPLYHASELSRHLALAQCSPLDLAVHSAWLTGFASSGAAIALVLLHRRLEV